MSKIFYTTPDGITWRGQFCAIVLRLIVYKGEALQSKGDTSGVSTKGTMMLKLISGTDKQVKNQSFS